MTLITAALVFGFILGVIVAGGILRARPRPFTIRLLDGVDSPTVLVELPDDYDARDPLLASGLAHGVTALLADFYGLPLGVTHPQADPALTDDVDLANPAAVLRAIAAHQRGDATFAIPHATRDMAGALTWHPGTTKAPPATTVKVVVAPTEALAVERLAELGMPTSNHAIARTVVVTIQDAYRHAAINFRPGELDFVAGAHPDVVGYMRSRIRIPRDQ